MNDVPTGWISLRGTLRIVAPLLLALGAAACSKPPQPPAAAEPAPAAADPAPAEPGATAFEWSSGFRVMGDGYPNPGDPCRRLGESELTGNYLDHTAWLIGCPGMPEEAAAASVVAAGGRVVGQAEGVTLISVPMPGAG